MDDGPATLDDAVALCRALVADGISTVIATPHQLGRYDGRNDADSVRRAVRELTQVLSDQGIMLNVRPGGDVRIDERLVRLIETDQVSTIADSGRCVLVELPHEVYLDPSRVLDGLCDAGLVPVLTHPERHRHLQQRPDSVARWVEQGAVLQLTAGSLLGDFGTAAQMVSRYWIAKGWVGVFATDAHGADNRPPRMTAAYQAVEMEFGSALARQLCVENPAALIDGRYVSPAVASEHRSEPCGMSRIGTDVPGPQHSQAAAAFGLGPVS